MTASYNQQVENITVLSGKNEVGFFITQINPQASTVQYSTVRIPIMLCTRTPLFILPGMSVAFIEYIYYNFTYEFTLASYGYAYAAIEYRTKLN